MSRINSFAEKIGSAVLKQGSVPFDRYGVGGAYGGFGGLDAFDRTFLPQQPGSARNDREDAGSLEQNGVLAACINAVGQALGEAPPILEERKAGDKWVPVNDHPAIHLLNNPNGFYGSPHLWISHAGSEITNGEGFTRVVMNRARTEPTSLWWERPETISIVGDADHFINHYWLLRNGVKYRVQCTANMNDDDGESDYLLHFRSALSKWNPRTGWSAVQAGYRQVVGDNSASTYHTALMRNVASIGLLVSLRQQMQDGIEITTDQMEKVKNHIAQTVYGEGAGGIAAINLPVLIEKIGLTPDEMALNELIAYYEYRICSLAAVDPMILGLGSGVQQKTYANFGEAINDFWERRIVPTKNRHAVELQLQYLPLWGLDPADYRISWDYSKVAPLQENIDELHARVRADYQVGLVNQFDAAGALGYETDEAMKSVRMGNTPEPQDGDGENTDKDSDMPNEPENKSFKLPEDNPDPFGMAFTDEEIAALTEDRKAMIKRCIARATPEMQALLLARPIERKPKPDEDA